MTTNQVLEKLDYVVSRTGLFDWVDKNEFPKPIRISSRKLMWRIEDVEGFLASKKF
ncbi:MAG: AlpA family phage regulatory protein [Candidatus Riflebacteria bacterium]|nr:AlpA family phage regulatory protein [Candidatus Riflebacteria bacterium]